MEQKQRLMDYLMRIDIVAGILLTAIAVLVWYGSVPLAVGKLTYFGSGFLPRVCAVAMLVGGLSILFRGLTQPPAEAERLRLAMRGPFFVGLAILTFAVTIKGFVVGPLTIPQLGLAVAGPLSIFISGLGTSEARPRELVILALGLTSLGIIVFVELLNVPLPVLPAFIARHVPPAWGLDWPPRIAALTLIAASAGLAWFFRSAIRNTGHIDTTGARP